MTFAKQVQSGMYPVRYAMKDFLINLLRLKYFKEGSKLWCLQIPQVELFFEGHGDSKQLLMSCVTQILDGTFPE